MLTIRLQRTGKKNAADFRIILAQKTASAAKKFLEVLGSYNPRRKDFKVNEERVKHWLSKRVELSQTIHNLFVSKGLLDAPKVKAFDLQRKAKNRKSLKYKPAQASTETPAAPSSETAAKEEAAEATATMEEVVTGPAEETAADAEAKQENAAA